MDIHIAERRRGGRHFVIDCKHFPKTNLNENEIRTTLEYKKRSKASKAIILVSKASRCPDKFLQSAKTQEVKVLKVSVVKSKLVNKIKDYFFHEPALKKTLQ